MSHEIESAMYVRQPAWHKLGNVLEEHPTTLEAYRHSGLEWYVDKKGLFFMIPNERNQIAGSIQTDMYALVRDTDSNILGYCTDSYTVYNNKDAFEWTRPLIDSGYWKYESAGSLKHGTVCWILLKQSEVVLFPNDNWKQYVLVVWNHTGSKANIIMPTTIRVVCQNTLTAALAGDHKKFVRHSSNVMMKMDEVRELYSATNEVFAKQAELMTALASKPFDDEARSRYTWNLFGYPSNLEGRAKTIAENNLDNAKRFIVGNSASGFDTSTTNGTAYSAYMGATEFIEHYIGGRRVADRGMNILFGSGAEMNRKALTEIRQMVNV